MDSKTVIDGLRHCHIYKLCSRCPYINYCGGCQQKVAEDAIDLIEKQEKLIEDITKQRMDNGAFD